MDYDFLLVVVALAAFFWIAGEWVCAMFRAGRSDQFPGRFVTALVSASPVWVLLTGFSNVPLSQRFLVAAAIPMACSVLYIGKNLTRRMQEHGFDRIAQDIPMFDPTRRPIWSAVSLLLLLALTCAAVVHAVSDL